MLVVVVLPVQIWEQAGDAEGGSGVGRWRPTASEKKEKKGGGQRAGWIGVYR